MTQKLSIIKKMEREVQAKKQAIALMKNKHTTPDKIQLYEIDLKHSRLKLARLIINYYK